MREKRGGECPRGERPIRLVDMHCHLDFGEDPQALAADLQRLGIGCLSATVTPDAYAGAASTLAPYDNVRVGLGMHPWWVAEGLPGDALLKRFEQLVSETRFIAEVGLDFGERHAKTREVQVVAFSRLVAACARQGGKIVSLHAVRAATEVMDVLEESGALACSSANACIFHWFSGTHAELQRAVEAGFFFSVNPRMLETKRGRSYAQAIPLKRLLLETDEPAIPGAPFDALAVERKLTAMLSQLAALRRVSYDELEERIVATSADLLSFA